MLNYHHAAHAGNHADVLKHLLLCKTLENLIQAPAPVLYIDTHSGAGRYYLDASIALTNTEYKSGVAALDFATLPDTRIYQQLVQDRLSIKQYPGSPLIAAGLLRQQDQLHLFETNSSEYLTLDKLLHDDPRVTIENKDGYQAIKALLPAKQHCVLLLMDPPYKDSSDYSLCIDSVNLAYRKMPTIHFLLWYPVINRDLIGKMIQNIVDKSFQNIWRFELCMKADSTQQDMTGSGMLVINPPDDLPGQMTELLPALAGQLSADAGFYNIEQITT